MLVAVGFAARTGCTGCGSARAGEAARRLRGPDFKAIAWREEKVFAFTKPRRV